MPVQTVSELASTATVTVASKLPFPLLMQLQEPRIHAKVSEDGERKEFILSHHVGRRIVIRGSAFPAQQGPRGEHVGGFALTPNVPADFFAAWLRENEDSDAVRNKFVFGFEKKTETTNLARDRKDELCGLEPLNPSKLPKDFQRKSAKIETMETD